MALEQIEVPDANAIRELWIADRIREFDENPVMRDRAIAIILFDSMMLHEQFEEMATMVRKEGLGGMIKALMGGLKK